MIDIPYLRPPCRKRKTFFMIVSVWYWIFEYIEKLAKKGRCIFLTLEYILNTIREAVRLHESETQRKPPKIGVTQYLRAYLERNIF